MKCKNTRDDIYSGTGKVKCRFSYNVRKSVERSVFPIKKKSEEKLILCFLFYIFVYILYFARNLAKTQSTQTLSLFLP